MSTAIMQQCRKDTPDDDFVRVLTPLSFRILLQETCHFYFILYNIGLVDYCQIELNSLIFNCPMNSNI